MPEQSIQSEHSTAPVFPDQAVAVRPRSVLVIDPDQQCGRSLSDAFSRSGYDAEHVETPQEAAPEEHERDDHLAVVIAIRSADVASMECIAAFWADRTPVIAVVASDHENQLDRCRAAGAIACVASDAPDVSIRAAVEAGFSAGFAVRTLEHRVQQLEKNLIHRRLVEQAKWKLVTEQGMTEPEAHTALQRHARNLRQPLPDVAEGVINGTVQL